MKYLAYDTETTGLDLLRSDKMFAFSLADEQLRSSVFRLDGSAVRQVRSQQKLQWVWQQQAPKVMHNAKFDLRATEKQLDCKLAETHTFHDTILQSHIVQNLHPSHRLKDLAFELAGIPKDDELQVKRYVPEWGNYQSVPEDIMEPYQHADAVRTMLLHLFFYPKIMTNSRWREVYETELDLVRTTLRMEERGVMVHIPNCRALISHLEQDVEMVLDEIESYAGKRINPDRPEPLRWLLFEKAGLPVVNLTEIEGSPSTDKDTLLELRESHPNPVLDMILKYRSWSRGITMLSQYLELADGEGVIHPNIRTCAAKTGRESCSNPNLQNVAKAEVVKNPFPVPARRAFRPRPGFVNFHIDYSGQEMRLLVDASGEDFLRRVVTRGTEEHEKYHGDIHLPAMEVFYGDLWRNPKHPRWKPYRDACKNTNFAIPYGASGVQAARTLGKAVQEGTLLLAAYRQRFPHLCDLTKTIVQQVKESGYVETSFGRTLHVPRESAYIGTNYKIQGTGAGIIKRAQNRVHKLLEEETGGEAGIILPIHDELVVEFPRNRLSEAPYIFRKIRKVMTDFPELTVPMDIEIKVTSTHWDNKVPFNLEET